MSCPNCFKESDQTAAAAKGSEIKVAGRDAYVTGSGKKAIVICTDVFGWKLAHCRAVADLYAAAGDYTVYVPDVLNDSFTPEQASQIHQLIGGWLARNPIGDLIKRTDEVVQELKSKHAGHINLVGFCLGVKTAFEVTKTGASSGLIKSVVAFHPSFQKEQDAAEMAATKVPILFCCAEVDTAFNPVRPAFEKELKGKNGEFIDYPHTEHGFGVRPTGEKSAAAANKAHQDATAWLATHA